MKKNQTEKRNTGCFSWLVRLKRSVNERWARERNTFLKKFHKDNWKSLAADKLLNETGTPDLLITKVPVCSIDSPAHREQTTEPRIRGFPESNEVASPTETIVEPDNETALALQTNSESVPVISEANDSNENNIRADVIPPVPSGIISDGLPGSGFDVINVFITCPLASRLDQQDSVFGEVSVAMTQDQYGAPFEYCATVSMY